MEEKIIERHPLQPFLPENAKILMLGSFPPPPKRWSMDFFYPNMQNDMWRIFGHIFFSNKNHFLTEDQKKFDKERIISFLEEKGIALYDTATAICRLQGNASDKFLEIIEPTDISQLLLKIPECRALVTTGQKATDTLCMQFNIEEPNVGNFKEFTLDNKKYRIYRMPSSSRAYPLTVEKKSESYRSMFEDLNML